jgi:hypothetical protein
VADVFLYLEIIFQMATAKLLSENERIELKVRYMFTVFKSNINL